MSDYRTIDVIDGNQTPLELIYCYFNRYFNENVDPAEHSNDCEKYNIPFIEELTYGLRGKCLTPHGYVLLYNSVRRFVIDNNITDLYNVSKELMILFKMTVLY